MRRYEALFDHSLWQFHSCKTRRLDGDRRRQSLDMFGIFGRFGIQYSTGYQTCPTNSLAIIGWHTYDCLPAGQHLSAWIIMSVLSKQ